MPSDYGVLQMLELPEDGTGGDTLFASAYEVYDRLSPPMKQMIDGLTVLNQACRLALQLRPI